MRPLCIYDPKSLDSVAAAAVVKHFIKDVEFTQLVNRDMLKGRDVYGHNSTYRQVDESGRTLIACDSGFSDTPLCVGMWQFFSRDPVPKFLSHLAEQELGDLKPESPVWEELLK